VMIRAALGTGGRLRRSEAIVGGEYDALQSCDMYLMWGGRRGRGVPRHPEILSSGYYRFLFRPLYEFLRQEIAHNSKLSATPISCLRNSPCCPLRQIDRK
jgi:hypothetical protein